MKTVAVLVLGRSSLENQRLKRSPKSNLVCGAFMKIAYLHCNLVSPPEGVTDPIPVLGDRKHMSQNL